MGSMIRIYREVEERLAEVAGAMTHRRSAAADVAVAVSFSPASRDGAQRDLLHRHASRDAEQLEALVGGLVAQMRVLRHAAEGYFDSPGQTPSA